MENTEQPKKTIRVVVRDILAVFVITALAILADKYVNVNLAWVVVIVGSLCLIWLEGFHKSIHEKFYKWHEQLGLWFVLLLMSICFLSAALYHALHPKVVVTIVEKLVDKGPIAGDVSTSPHGGIPYVWIPPGTFKMGCVPSDKSCEGDEKPQKQKKISHGFWLGQTEVTVEEYKRYIVAHKGKDMPKGPPFNTSWDDGRQPIVNLTWKDASDFCRWDDGRLPTEAEWEYAARGRSETTRYGDIDEVAWYSGNSGDTAHSVATKSPNYLGLYDMIGNAWEWMSDKWAEDYYQDSPEIDPQGPEEGDGHVLRGGVFRLGPERQRLSNRNRESSDKRAITFNTFGVRCARD